MSFWAKLLIIVGVFSAFFVWHLVDKTEAVKAAKNEVVIEYTQKENEARVAKERDEKALRAAQAQALKDKDEKIKAISSQLDSTLSSLQHYKACSELVAKPASIGTPCPSRELSREDGQFLAREAAKADSVVVERDYYYGRYEDARKRLEAR